MKNLVKFMRGAFTKSMSIILSFSIAVCILVFTSTDVLAATSNATVNDGVYTLSSKASGFMMNVYAGKDANGTKVTTWKFDGTVDQRINVKHIGNGKYLLYAMCSSSGTNRVIDIYRGTRSVATGQYVDIWSPNDSVAQQFYINPQGDGSFTIELASLPGNVLACTNAWINGAKLQLQKFTGANSQKWYFNNTSGQRVDPAIKDTNGKFMWPVDMNKAMITQTFNQHTYTTDKGLDIGSYGHVNLPIYAADSGKVITSAYGAYGEGNYIKINHGNGKITIYEHLKSRNVSLGQQVSKGQQIGIMGTTGNSTGVHLHFGLVVNGKKVNPRPYLP